MKSFPYTHWEQLQQAAAALREQSATGAPLDTEARKILVLSAWRTLKTRVESGYDR